MMRKILPPFIILIYCLISAKFSYQINNGHQHQHQHQHQLKSNSNKPTDQSNNQNASIEEILGDTFMLLDTLDRKLGAVHNKTPAAMMRDNLRSLNLGTGEQSFVDSDASIDEALVKLAHDLSPDRRPNYMDSMQSSATIEQAKVSGQNEGPFVSNVVPPTKFTSEANVHEISKRARHLISSDDNLQSDFTEGHIKFTLDLMQSIFSSQSYTAKTNSIESFLISPFSIQMVLMMIHLGSKGQTRRELGNCLHFTPERVGPATAEANVDASESTANKLKRRHHLNYSTSVGSSGNENGKSKSRPNRQPSRPAIASTTNAHELFGNAMRNLLKDPIVVRALTSANQIFLQKTLVRSPHFDWAIRHYYGTDIKMVDFQHQNDGPKSPGEHQDSGNSSEPTGGDIRDDQPENVQKMINDWIERQTKGKINNFLTSPVATSTLLMAINVLFYKGDWQYKFDQADTEAESTFTRSDGRTLKMPMMVNRLPLAFAHDPILKTSVVELPYKAQRLGLFLLLPDEVSGIFHTMKMLNSTSFANLISSMRKPTASSDQANNGINVRIPKFNIESSFKMSQILSEYMGLKTLFSSDTADLSGILSVPKRSTNATMKPGQQQDIQTNPIQMGLDELLHKAVLQVDEQGSVAAASSAAIVERVGLFNSNYFEADHPFLLFLMDKQTGLVLFSGAFAGENTDKDPVNQASSVNNNNNINLFNGTNGNNNLTTNGNTNIDSHQQKQTT